MRVKSQIIRKEALESNHKLNILVKNMEIHIILISEELLGVD